MLTLKEISESFYKSTGASQEAFRQYILDYLDRLYSSSRSYSISSLLRDMKTSYTDAQYIVLTYSSKTDTFILSPETVDDKIKKIPNWFIFRDSSNRNILTASDRDATNSISIVIRDLPNLESLEGLPEAFRALQIINCPKIEPKHLSIVKRLKTLIFKPDPNKTYMYKDVVKYIKKVEDEIDLNFERGGAVKKLIDIERTEKEKTKTTTTSTINKPVAKSSLSFPDIARANAEGRVMGRFKPVPVDNTDEAPTWYCRQSDWTISDGDGNIIGFTTKKFNVIYRKGLKIMKFDLRKRYALDLHDNIIAKVVLC